MFYKIIIWKNLSTNELYHKIVKSTYKDYYVGYKNHYNHVIVYIIDDLDIFSASIKNSMSLKMKILNYQINFVEKYRSHLYYEKFKERRRRYYGRFSNSTKKRNIC